MTAGKYPQYRKYQARRRLVAGWRGICGGIKHAEQAPATSQLVAHRAFLPSQATVSRLMPWWPAPSPKRGRRAATAATPATTRKTRVQDKEGHESSEGEEAAAAAVTPTAVAKTPVTGRRTAARVRTAAKTAETPGVRTSQRLRARTVRE